MDGLVLAVSGKGGVGKTTVAALLLKALLDAGKESILVIDADPDANLAEVLGIQVEETVGKVANELKKQASAGKLPASISKREYLEARIFEVLMELPQFDLLVMGRTEGEGCYCLLNDLLTDIIDKLSNNYEVTLMDMEAGLEHLSRRTDRDVDVMVIVVDGSRLSHLTAKRIKELASEVHINFKRIVVVGNRMEPELEKALAEKLSALGLELVGVIPTDQAVASYELEGKSLLSLPKESPAVKAAAEIAWKIGLI